MSAVKLQDLRCFVAVATQRSFTPPAERSPKRFAASQPTLSRGVDHLEAEFELELVRRKPFALTAAGELLLPQAEQILRLVSRLEDSLTSQTQQRLSSLRVGFADTPSRQFRSQAMDSFSRDRLIHIEPRTNLSTAELFGGLRSGELHVAVTVPLHREQFVGYKCENLCRYPVCVALKADDPLARDEHVEFASLRGRQFVGFDAFHYPEYHDWALPLLGRLGVEAFLYECQSASDLEASIVANTAVCLVASCFAEALTDAVVMRRFKKDPGHVRVVAAYIPGVDEAAKSFIHHAQTAVRELGLR